MQMGYYFWILAFACFFALSTTSQAHHPPQKPRQSYLITVKFYEKPSVFPHVGAWYRSFLKDPKNIFYIYDNGGFAATLSSSEVSELKKRPEVVQILPDGISFLHQFPMDHKEEGCGKHKEEGCGKNYASINGSEILDRPVTPPKPQRLQLF